VNAADETLLLRAAWVAPMDGPPIRDAAVVISGGVVVDVGPAQAVRARRLGATIEDLGDALLAPGLVNAHTHLELSTLAAGPSPASFADWLISLMARLSADRDRAEAAAQRGTLAGVAQCLRFGVTTVGDITGNARVTRAVLRGSPLRGVSFGEVRAMATRRGLLDAQLGEAADVSTAGGKLTPGLSPHAPYTVEPDGYRKCLERAARAGLPLTTHLAETPDEAAFLRDHSGPLRDVWDWRGGWDDAVPTFEGGPIRFAKSLGLLDAPTLLAHVNYCDDDELDLLAAGRASVAYCPRTHAYFGHPPHRWREMLGRGINVCIGTDSCASSPDLNLLDDVRLLHRIAPEVPALTLWQMATARAAEAIGVGDVVGTIAPGKAADLIAFDAAGENPLVGVLEATVSPKACWIGGRPIDGARGEDVSPSSS
jgi:cytosine/adenosine deaminase-related metal-dependent hydrolase